MKPVIALPIEHYESILKHATEDSPLYFRLKNAVKMANTVVVRYDPEHAEMLLQAAKHFCPDAVPEIQQAIRVSSREEAGSLIWCKKRMDELAGIPRNSRPGNATEIFDQCLAPVRPAGGFPVAIREFFYLTV